jgi:hydrogenase maturation protein HypF
MVAGGHIIRVRGMVQGVGFRPAVWRIARDLGLSGHVRNDGAGVVICVWGDSVEVLVERLKCEVPPLARIEGIAVGTLDTASPGGPFEILASVSSEPDTAIVPDAATCAECLAEVLDPGDRRHNYEFANCTNCGPRLSIIKKVPYDRCNTSMADFVMCPDCAREYGDPSDRRFHAQPIACPTCGPRLWLENREGVRSEGDAIAGTALLIQSSAIVAIKGIGGFHLACDATNEDAVKALRTRKRRDTKPFALMARDVQSIVRFAHVGESELKLLQSPAAPILLLRRKLDGPQLASGVAPKQDNLGFMLPYSPLHHLLMRQSRAPIVLTSGNLTDEPQCFANDDARGKLGLIADAFCMHDREIVNRLDDSVVRWSESGPIIIRRARGLAPSPIGVHRSFGGARPVLATGSDLKSTVAFLRNGSAIVSQHIGDLTALSARDDYGRAIELHLDLFKVRPAAVASDLHPDFYSTQIAATLAARFGCPHVPVQHHHAHVAACMAENGIAMDTAPILGIALDGTGFGSDGFIWGGEFLIADYNSFERVGHFKSVPLLGGDQAARQPWRNAYAHLSMALGWERVLSEFGDVPAVARLTAMPIAAMERLSVSGLGSPPCSSAGRLFDAVAALLDVCFERQDYEGEAAICLEGLASRVPSRGVTYEVDAVSGILAWPRLFTGILRDLKQGRDHADIARQFHDSLIVALVQEAQAICSARNISCVALSGGCFNNVLLLDGVVRGLKLAGLDALIHKELPSGDGGISLGQCTIAAAFGSKS